MGGLLDRVTRADSLNIALACAGIAAAAFLGGALYWGAALLIVAGVALAIWLHHRDEPASTLTWTEIEARMKDLRAKDIDHSSTNRADGPIDAVQTPDTSGRQRWRLRGSNEQLRADAERLFALAGRKLKRSGIVLSARVAREKDDCSRWLWFLVEVGKHEKHLKTTTVTPATGRVETHTYWLREVLNDSIAACVECLKREA